MKDMEIGVIGTSVWQHNFPLIERLTIDREKRELALEQLKRELGLTELIYLATCNRVEFIYIHPGDGGSKLLHGIIDYFLKGQRDLSFFPNDFYQYTDREAISHIFRTVSSLESLVVGETQITGQFKDAVETATETGLAGPHLESLSREALTVARQVKRDTNIGAGSVSMASLAATELSKAIDGREQPVIALIGSGPMTRKLANHLKKIDRPQFLFVNRTVEKAQSLADEFGGSALVLNDFVATPPKVDAVLSATAAPGPVFNADFLNRLHNNKPVACVDLAVPRDFSIEYSQSDKVVLLDIPALKRSGQGNLRQKFVEASKANEIVRDAVSRYLANRIEGSLKPIFQSSYQQSLDVARRALDQLFDKKMPHMGDDDREAVIRLVNKLIGQTAFQPARLLSDRLVEARSDLNINTMSGTKKEAV